MNVWMRGLMVFVLFFAGQTMAGEIEKSISLTLNEDGPCKSLSLGISFAARHTKGGDRGGLLNQDTYGKFAECFFDKERHFYRITGALTNSQWCSTAFDGLGYRAYSPKMWRLQGEIGYEVALTYYGTGCAGGRFSVMLENRRRGALIAPLPTAYIGVSAEMPSLGEMFPVVPAYKRARWMTSPLGKLTFGMRLPGFPFTKKATGENILLFGVTLTRNF